ncbi:MAG: pyridoxamine 5'-phosphate oxidase family protein [Oscillospiraceae bacterium]|jgi:uncharacterized pyridoxamine 5'-phosphate oxidase family protein|nr:pyridoxamine 5'-phosphate oxidase family protein [Oscillospiraceae bacterium]
MNDETRRVFDFLKAVGTYYIATVSGDKPSIRPFGTINRFNDKLYIQTGKSKDFYKQVEKNPNFEISAFDGKGSWLRIAGELVSDDSAEAVNDMLGAYPSLKAMYEAGDGNAVTLYFKDAKATWYSFTGAPETIELN